ncbi:hypothetical protein Tsubulata_020000 [Turnera subulata]|uniref:YDG domain-containing protein n=1 Tax=Turnera subulata TaxID=218843 RepID=A0A9Q0FVK8_9ROSI|nr:hypothetical protein Tsubulata_020000 [Turnera subulata]
MAFQESVKASRHQEGFSRSFVLGRCPPPKRSLVQLDFAPCSGTNGEQSYKKLKLGSVSNDISSPKGKSVVLVDRVKQEGNRVNVINQELHPPKESSVSCAEVKEVLRLFKQEYGRLKSENGRKRLSYLSIISKAAMAIKGKWVNTKGVIGHVPGVDIGDQFRLRAELRIIGLHRQFERGIDYMQMEDGTILATSIVETPRYGNRMMNDTLFYIGEGENPEVKRSRPVRDQRLVGGNLALMNSMKSETPVRVIRLVDRKFSKLAKFRSTGRKNDLKSVYEYYGLYSVVNFKQKRLEESGKLIFEFVLKRCRNQCPL